MQNRRHKFIKQALQNKSRSQRWRNIILCLSFVVVFCTVFALIHPAITLEDTKQEHVHNDDCYSSKGDLICTESDEFVENNESIDSVNTPELNSTEPSDADNETTDVQEEETQIVEPESNSNSQDSFDLSVPASASKVASIALSYQDESGNWHVIEQDNKDKISPNKWFKFTVNYKDIQINNLLKNYNRTLKYTLPDILRDATVDGNGNIMSGTENVGSIWVTDGVVYVQFEEGYLNRLTNAESTTINGDFYVSAKINLSKLPGDGKLTINTANKEYQFNFEEDAIAKYGQVTVEKECTSSKVISDDSGDYLAYTICVTAGQDGAKAVSIVDYFTSNSDLVSFVGITEKETTIINEEDSMKPYETIADGKTHGSIYKGKIPTDNTIPSANDSNITEPGSLVWKIGDMSANETRSLTYHVKLKDGVDLSRKALNNNAKLFSRSYFRQEDNAVFTPTIDYERRMYKRNETPVRLENGSYRIPYTLHFSISKENSNYSLRNFVFWDYLDYSDNFHTDPTVRQYVSYDQSSVKLFVKRYNETEFSEMPVSDYTVNWSNGDVGSKPTRFSVTGKANHPLIVNPGDEYYVSYSLNVSNEAMAAMKSNSVKILNRFIVDASNAKKYESYIDRVYDEVNVGNYNWNEKNVGNVTANNQTITMNEKVYNSSFQPDSTTSFIVPSGSYPYTVKVNQTLGDWDATNITMKDILTPADRMQYVGYVKIEACEYDSIENTYRTVETKWVNIDGKSSFSIKPSDIGWSNNKYSYFITYYAHPVNQEQFSQATIKNSFTLEGNVTNGTSSYSITGIKSEKLVTCT